MKKLGITSKKKPPINENCFSFSAITPLKGDVTNITLSFISLLLPLISFFSIWFRKWNSNTRTSTKCRGRFKCNYCLGRYCSSLCSADRQDADKAFFKSHCNFYIAMISRDFNLWIYTEISRKNTCEIARI